MSPHRTHHIKEPHAPGIAARLNWLRAGVLGANDGIISTAALVIGVAGAGGSRLATLTAGVAGLAAGAFSMAAGEYASVSSQRDSQQQLIALETWELQEIPEAELNELTAIYKGKGLSADLARQVAVELTEHDALRAHAEAELNINIDEIVNPWSAAFASAISFALGAILPLVSIAISPSNLFEWITVAIVIAALTITGIISAKLGGASVPRAIIRLITSGMLAMGATFGIGYLFGTTVG